MKRFWFIILLALFSVFNLKSQVLSPEIESLKNESAFYGFKDYDGRYAVLSLISMSLSQNFMAMFDIVLAPGDESLGTAGRLFYKIVSTNSVECWLKFPTLKKEYKVLECEFLHDEEKVKIDMYDYSNGGDYIMTIYLPKGSSNITKDFFESLKTGDMY